ncbi:uncharacterized protein YecE (DUF72 family) [Hydrogenivirga caldilitoris]|uniref:Uncharacterized protein YecE (DUF72 family) n=1 Tax=Hydrogenivirga caldilitoris TaxID=246264 RepID=A0A497XRZ4_9AQUI|nr:DUF72 domain-containing protein [Hydrogenivirga caldilitoris]RLJ70930.1 uncharacterized protein YecE (DUF72 family) [Hydrogenivirga caldilitoris]
MREEDKVYFLGCSGYFYWGWKGKFYPQELQPKEWLSYYARLFNTVEINSTFYNFPKVSNLRRFYKETPRGFLFSVKMNRTITHVRKLRDVADMIRDFYGVVREGLREKLGCILFQLPPSYKYSEQNLERVLCQLDSDFKNVIEFRHESWWRDEVYKALRDRDITFCSVSSPKFPEVLIQTSDTVYIRFHGKEGWYRYNYSEEELKEWAERIRNSSAREVFAYFNNDYNAYAPHNCLKLAELLDIKPYREVS